MKINKFNVVWLLGFLIILSFLINICGTTMNNKVIENNNNKMPVFTIFQWETLTHFSFQKFSEVNNPFFSDIIHIKKTAYSMGDFLIYFSWILFALTELTLIVNSVYLWKCNQKLSGRGK